MSRARDASEKCAFIGVHHTCCNAYSRAYINPARTAFDGRCPGCGRRVHLPIGPEGSKSRLWRAS